LTTTYKHEEESEDIVPVDGPLFENQVIPDTTEEGLRELNEKKTEDINEDKDDRNDKQLNKEDYKTNAEERSDVKNQKDAEETPKLPTEENDQNADIAQVTSQELLSPSPSSGGTTLDTSSNIPSSLQSGGTSPLDKPSIPNSGGICTISPQVSTTISDASSSADNPTKGPSADTADNPDNPILSSSHVLLLPPRTGIGVPDTSPPPTASFSTAGDYATASSASSASSENIANNPDNPYAGFDSSVPVPDNPRKPASDHWAYVASRG
jgi:hypothetical protein